MKPCINKNCKTFDKTFKNNCLTFGNSENLKILCKPNSAHSKQGYLSNPKQIDPNIKPDKKIVLKKNDNQIKSVNKVSLQKKFDITIKALKGISLKTLSKGNRKTQTTIQIYYNDVFNECGLKFTGMAIARKKNYLEIIEDEYDELFKKVV